MAVFVNVRELPNMVNAKSCRDVKCRDVKCRDVKCTDVKCRDVKCTDVKCTDVNVDIAIATMQLV